MNHPEPGSKPFAPPPQLHKVRVAPARYPLRWLTAAIALAIVLFIVVSFAISPNIDWKVVRDYFLDGTILSGIELTLILTVASMIVGIAGGVLLAVMRLSDNLVLNAISMGYVWLFRATPLLIQIILWYNLSLVFPHLGLAIPTIGINWTVSTNAVITPVSAAILALGLNESAYMAEIVRGGIISVAHGQGEAATALGMTKGRAMWSVVLPQSVRSIIPPTGNQLIGMLKNTSLVSVIAARELLTAAQQIYSANFYTIELLFVASAWYLIITSATSVGQIHLERRFAEVNRVGQRSFLDSVAFTLSRIGRKRYIEVAKW